jgi:hypothetical protein
MDDAVIARRRFVFADQETFASVSGDYNPLHMNAIAARRTVAGAPVVHGIHALLWALESLYRKFPQLSSIASIDAAFEKFIYVDDDATAVLARRDEKSMRVDVTTNGVRLMRAKVGIGDTQSWRRPMSSGPLLEPSEPRPLTFEEMKNCHGRVTCFLPADQVCTLFPALAQMLGVSRVAALVRSSYLVGMVCPGLHSMNSGLSVKAVQPGDLDEKEMHFRVASSDPRFRLMKIEVEGCGWRGSIDAHARPEPTPQPDLQSIARKVTPGEFSDAIALVVGGSRGLGELVSKILLAGGAEIVLTYSVGEADAKRLQQEFSANGLSCRVMQYEVNRSAAAQLCALPITPNQVYYMPTPRIFGRQANIFDQRRFEEFLRYYVSGFNDLYRAINDKCGGSFSMLYPSSVAVSERPSGMVEYAMAKSAGEILCEDIRSFGPGGKVLARRLPRLLTDQTATFMEVATTDPAEIMIPIVREVHANRFGG